MPRVLVVGDWLVDEHWVVGRHRSESASRSGLRHSRALHTADCSVRSLCGAGQVATILCNAWQDDVNGAKTCLFEVHGMGLWHSHDEKELKFMLNPLDNAANTPHRLIPVARSQHPTPPVSLYNLAIGYFGEHVGTTRVIRVYEQQRLEIALRDRLDWELRLEPDIRDGMRMATAKAIRQIPDLEQFKFVVVKDLGKGVVTTDLIQELAKATSHAQWYVSSKAWNPSWYAALPSKQVQLLLVPQLAATKAIREEQVSSSTWIVSAERGSREALQTIDGIAKSFPSAHIVVLPDGMMVLGRDPFTKTNPKGYRQTDPGDHKRASVVPMASVFFPALISRMAIADGTLEFNAALEEALDFTDEWMRLEYRRLVEPNWRPAEAQHLCVTNPYDRGNRVRPFGWDNVVRHWREATEKLGIVLYVDSKKNKNKLQLWRSMTEVSGYIACVPSKRKVLKTLVEQGRLFNRERRHMAFMLIDTPGSGKSYLVGCLAKQLDMRFVQFNVTQMLTREDLMQSFDKVVTSQAQSPEEGLLVFVDEINARLEGQHVYDAFLAPLEEGVYVRGGNTFHIAPCFWIFAGTRRPSPERGVTSTEAEDKASDFESRLTAPPFPLSGNSGNPRDQENAALEKVYIGAATIQRFFPDVRSVSSAVLDAIHRLPPDITPRAIAQFVKRFRNVQYGIVTASNLPVNWQQDYTVESGLFLEWKRSYPGEEKEDMIDLESNPTSDLQRDQDFRYP